GQAARTPSLSTYREERTESKHTHTGTPTGCLGAKTSTAALAAPGPKKRARPDRRARPAPLARPAPPAPREPAASPEPRERPDPTSSCRAASSTFPLSLEKNTSGESELHRTGPIRA